jgi:Na+-transporting NADH:ubiquinone oxidoreductase subunit NqrE
LKVWSSRSRGCCVEKGYTFYEGICFAIDIGDEIAIEVKEKIQERIGYSNLSRELSQLIVTLFRFIYIKLGVMKGSNDSISSKQCGKVA